MQPSRHGSCHPPIALARRESTAASYKRGRAESDESVQTPSYPTHSNFSLKLKPSEATPCFRPSAAAALSTLPGGPHTGCIARWLDEDSRSQSSGAATTESHSEDNAFFVDLGCTQRPEGVDGWRPAPPMLRRADNEDDAAEWQQQLSDFFSKLDRRPLRVVPRE